MSAPGGGHTSFAPGEGRHAFEYVLLRAVPRVERGEFINVGVIVYCQELDYLGAAVELDEERLRALDPRVDAEALRKALGAVVQAAAEAVGSQRENSGKAARFGALTAPRSTVLQPSPIHAGVTDDPEVMLQLLKARLVSRTG